MKTYEKKTMSEEETQHFAIKLAKRLERGDVITLEGDLGVGKTTFTKGLAKGLNIKSNISSPTFTIIKEYVGRLPLYHMDAYRLEHSDEDIGFEEYFYGDGVSVIEWAQYIEDYLPEERLAITIKYEENNSRKLIFQPIGSKYVNRLKDLFHE